MEDIEWATTMADPDTAPDYFLDALKNARELGQDGYAQEVVGTAVNMLIDSEALNPVINALLLSLQAFGGTSVELGNGPVTIIIKASDAPAE